MIVTRHTVNSHRLPRNRVATKLREYIVSRRMDFRLQVSTYSSQCQALVIRVSPQSLLVCLGKAYGVPFPQQACGK
eukprot:2208152-Amphidinium_carterae.1